MPLFANKYEYSVVSPGTPAYEEYCALRYEVFCEELGRVSPSAANTKGLRLETDDFDAHSLHVLCRSAKSGETIACARLVLPGPNGLNVLSRYRLHEQPASAPTRVGEIGRLALSNKLRRDRRSSLRGEQSNELFATEDVRKAAKRDGSAVALGLYREILRLAHAHGISHCYAAMEPALARLFNRICFPFQEAGPVNHNVQPPRQPFVISAQALRTGLETRNSCLYRFMFGGEEAETAPHKTDWPSLAKFTLPLA